MHLEGPESLHVNSSKFSFCFEGGGTELERLHAPAGIASLSSAHARLVYRLPKPTPTDAQK